MTLMTPAKLEFALTELATLLNTANIEADFYLVGGAAMSIGYMPDRRMTNDVDAKVKNFDSIQPFVIQIAKQHGLANDWINTAVSKLISQMAGDVDWVLWTTCGGVRYYIAGPELLLAMKVAASRPSKDAIDIAKLIEHLEISSVAHVEYLFEKYFPGEVLPQKASRLLSVLLDDVN